MDAVVMLGIQAGAAGVATLAGVDAPVYLDDAGLGEARATRVACAICLPASSAYI